MRMRTDNIEFQRRRRRSYIENQNEGARSPPIVAILKQNKGNFCYIIINFLLSLTNLFINRIEIIGDLNHYLSTFFVYKWSNQILIKIKLIGWILNYLIRFIHFFN